MENQINTNWLSRDVQARIETPTIMFAYTEDIEERQTNIIKPNIWRNLASLALETHKPKMKILNNSQPEELPALPKNFN